MSHLEPPVPRARTAIGPVRARPVLGGMRHASERAVAAGRTGRVLRGDSGNPIDGGEVQIIRVGKRETVGKVRLTTDQVTANPNVRLSPP